MKPTILFRGPVKTRSGYGSHSRDLLEALYQMNLFDIRIDSCMWGNTPMTALESDNTFHKWIEGNIVSKFDGLPDIYIQVTVPNEFKRFGKFNIGITAGIETTVAPKDWVDGCNQMDLIIATSNFSKDILSSTVYDERNKTTNDLINQYKITKPIEVLFEGVDTKIYNDKINPEFKLDIKEDFAYLFVGHWLKGNIGQDRKDVGMLIKCFVESFKDYKDSPALVLKTSSSNFSVKERESFIKKIKDIVGEISNPPSIYLLFGDLSNKEMNDLYNHPKIKSMISITKGEGFGRPLLEFTMTGKPVIASNWSGHKDFLPLDKSVMIGGKLTDVDDSSIDQFIIKGSKWFTANYSEVVEIMKLVKDDYKRFLSNSFLLKEENSKNFSLEKMKERFQEILKPYLVVAQPPPQHTKLILPKLNKVK
jgi:glycosyltransferase involved in cell wall biosynthesis